MPKAVSKDWMRAVRFGVARPLGEVPAVERLGQAEFHLLQLRRRLPPLDVRHRFRARGDGRALMAARQEVRSPDLSARVGQMRRQHDERRQVPVHRPQPMAHPGADARPGEGHRAGMDAERGLEMVRVIVAHRADQAQIVGALGDVREKLADPQARLAALLEFPLRPLEVLLHHAVVRREGFQHLLRHLERTCCGRRTASACSRTSRRATRRRSCSGR